MTVPITVSVVARIRTVCQKAARDHSSRGGSGGGRRPPTVSPDGGGMGATAPLGGPGRPGMGGGEMDGRGKLGTPGALDVLEPAGACGGPEATWESATLVSAGGLGKLAALASVSVAASFGSLASLGSLGSLSVSGVAGGLGTVGSAGRAGGMNAMGGLKVVDGLAATPSSRETLGGSGTLGDRFIPFRGPVRSGTRSANARSTRPTPVPTSSTISRLIRSAIA